MTPSPAFSANSAIDRSAKSSDYMRHIHLPRLIGIWPSQINDFSRETTALIVHKLYKALRAERQKGRSGHWAYDFNKHLSLVAAYKAEKARLASRR